MTQSQLERELSSFFPSEPAKSPPSWKERWFFSALFLAACLGFGSCLLIALPLGLVKEIYTLRKEVETLSQKISSYEEYTKPEYELIEPLHPSATLQSSV